MQDLAKQLQDAFAEALSIPARHSSGANRDDHDAMVKQSINGLATLSDDARRHVGYWPLS